MFNSFHSFADEALAERFGFPFCLLLHTRAFQTDQICLRPSLSVSFVIMGNVLNGIFTGEADYAVLGSVLCSF